MCFSDTVLSSDIKIQFGWGNGREYVWKEEGRGPGSEAPFP